MKKDWENKRLGDLCTIKGRIGYRGYTKQDLVEEGEGAITLSPSNITNNKLHFDKCRYISWKKYEESPEIMIYEGDIIYCKTASIGKMALVETLPKKATLNPQFVVLKNIQCSNRFLYYYLISNEFINQAKNITGGTAIPTLSQKNLSNLTIPLIDTFSQKRIAEKLDTCIEQIHKAIKNVEQNIQNAEELFQSYLNDIFSQKGDGWNVMTLGELGKVSMCKRILKKQTSQTGDIPFYKIGTFGKTPNAFIDNEIFQEYKQKYSFPNKGDILISASGTIGRRVIYDDEPAYFQDSNIVWIQNNEEFILNEYLYQFYGICDWNPSKGATILRLYNDDLRRIQISFPNIVEQKKLVKVMNKLKSQTQTLQLNYQQELGALDELKKSILEKAFNGEL